jgi:hypothetical protein
VAVRVQLSGGAESGKDLSLEVLANEPLFRTSINDEEPCIDPIVEKTGLLGEPNYSPAIVRLDRPVLRWKHNGNGSGAVTGDMKVKELVQIDIAQTIGIGQEIPLTHCRRALYQPATGIVVFTGIHADGNRSGRATIRVRPSTVTTATTLAPERVRQCQVMALNSAANQAPLLAGCRLISRSQYTERRAR